MEDNNIKEKKIKRHRSLKRGLTATLAVLFVGIGLIILGQGTYQREKTEKRNIINSQLILNQFKESFKSDENLALSNKYQFDESAQNSLMFVSTVLQETGYFEKLYDEHMEIVTEQQALLNARLQSIREEYGANTFYVFEKSGRIVASDTEYYCGYDINNLFPDVDKLIVYEETFERYQNGTFIIDLSTDKKSYCPVLNGDEYIYSFLCVSDTSIVKEELFVCSTTKTDKLDVALFDLLNKESEIRIDNDTTEGVFALVNTKTKRFDYFADGNHVLTGLNYLDYGLKEEATTDEYAGYQTVDGTNYFAVSLNIEQTQYSENLVLIHFINSNNMFINNYIVIAISCIAFGGLFSILFAFSVIVRHDNQRALIKAKKKKEKELMEEDPDLTKEEIENTSSRYIASIMQDGNENFSRGIMLGKKGNYISLKSIQLGSSIAVIGTIMIFLLSYFTQTLFSIQEVTRISNRYLDEATHISETNIEKAKSSLQNINDIILKNSDVSSFLFSEEIDYALDFQDKTLESHQVYVTNDKGDRVPLKDLYGNNCYSVSNSLQLKNYARLYGLNYAIAYDDRGYALAASNSNWYDVLSKNKEDDSYKFREIIEEKTNYYLSEIDLGEDETYYTYCGVPFYYYTYNKDGVTKFVSKNYITEEMSATKHRGVLVARADQSAFASIIEKCSIENILKSLKVYSENSFYMAFDDSNEHNILYAPMTPFIGKSAESIGLCKDVFSSTSTINRFASIDGNKYYVSCKYINNTFILSAVSESSLYETRIASTFILVGVSLVLSMFGLIYFSINNKGVQIKKVIALAPCYSIDKEDKIIETPKQNWFEKMINPHNKIEYNQNKKWKDKSSGEKLSTFIFSFFCAISFAILIIFAYTSSHPNSTSLFGFLTSGNWEKGFNIFSVSSILLILLVSITLSRLLSVILRGFSEFLSNKGKTFTILFASIIRVGIVLAAIFYSLYLIGFDLTAILASAGILSVIVGIGANSIIGDVLSGIITAFENTYQTGDIVKVGDFRGEVIELGLRTTKIRAKNGNIKIINNKSVDGLLNLSKEKTSAFIEFGIDFGEDTNRVNEIFRQELPLLSKKNSKLLDDPICLGISSFTDSAINYAFFVRCEEVNRPAVERFLKQEIYNICVRHNIAIPFTQVTLSIREEDKKNFGSSLQTIENQASSDVIENDDLNNNEKMIYLLVKNNSKENIDSLVEDSKLSRSTVIRVLNTLQEKEYIERVGAKKDGHWVIKK